MRFFLVTQMLFLMLFITPAGARNQNDGDCRHPDRYDSYILALTWQPGFCEHLPGASRKPECVAMAKGRINIDHLTLHGLWPNKKSCGIDYGHCPGPPLRLRGETITALQPWMPNWYYGTEFGEYEWRKHGTCQTALADDEYFRKAVNAVITVNNSDAGQYLRQNIGGTISRRTFFSKIEHEVDDARAIDNVLLLCEGGYLYEIRILVSPDFEENRGMATMFQGALAERIRGDAKECRGDRIRIERSGL
jgi:ribonuclease T2